MEEERQQSEKTRMKMKCLYRVPLLRRQQQQQVLLLQSQCNMKYRKGRGKQLSHFMRSSANKIIIIAEKKKSVQKEK